jgi:hypothetical protein
MVPGLDTATVLRSAAGDGARSGILTAVGVATGCLCWGLAAAFGLVALMHSQPRLFDLVRWVGAIYLCWIGFRLLSYPGRAFVLEQPAKISAPRRAAIGSARFPDKHHQSQGRAVLPDITAVRTARRREDGRRRARLHPCGDCSGMVRRAGDPHRRHSPLAAQAERHDHAGSCHRDRLRPARISDRRDDQFTRLAEAGPAPAQIHSMPVQYGQLDSDGSVV